MRMKSILKAHFLIAISALLSALWLPSSLFAANFPEAGDFAAGAQSWANNCSRCHNMRDPQDLRDDQWVTTLFHMRVRAGLTGQQTRDILTFLQESNNQVIAVPVELAISDDSTSNPATGQDVYNQTCVACHGVNGKGTVPGAPDFTSPSGPLSQPNAVLLQHITEGYQSKGSPMAMPPKGGNMALTEEDIQSVLTYLHENFGK